MPPAATPASLFRHFARYARPGVPKYVAMREAIAHGRFEAFRRDFHARHTSNNQG